MDELNTISSHGKVSPALLASLAQLGPKQTLRAVIVLNTTPASLGTNGRRPNRDERQALIDKTRSSASQALPKIDAILIQFNGRRLSKTPTVLGTISIESTPAGIVALSQSDSVKAILQDQPASRVG